MKPCLVVAGGGVLQETVPDISRSLKRRSCLAFRVESLHALYGIRRIRSSGRHVGLRAADWPLIQ